MNNNIVNDNNKKRFYVAAMTKLSFIKDNQVVVNNYTIEDKVNDSGCYEGFLTNEVPTYCLIDYAIEHGYIFDRMVFFVTPECDSEKGTVIDGNIRNVMNTKEYFEWKVKEYLSKKIVDDKTRDIIIGKLHNKDGDIVKNYIDEVIKPNYIYLPDNMDNNELYHSVMGVMKDVKDFSNVELYYDITGGLRLPQFVSMILIRGMEDLNASVNKVVYVDITKNPKKIIDCTKNYKISSIFRLDDTNGDDKIKLFENLGISENGFDADESKKTDAILEQMKSETLVVSEKDKKKTEEHIKSINKKNRNSTGLLGQSQQQSINKIRQITEEQNPFANLLNSRNESIIKNFNEELIKAFYCINFLDLSENNNSVKKLTSSVKYAFEYYMTGYQINKNNNEEIEILHSVIKETQKMLESLKSNISLNATDLFKSWLDIRDERYVMYHNPYPKELTERKIRGIIKEYPDFSSGLDLLSIFKKEISYANYGFPMFYAEEYNYGNKHQNPREYYIKKVQLLCEKIDSEWKEKKNTAPSDYRDYLDKEKDNLVQNIPFSYFNNYWRFDRDISDIKNSGGSIESFMKTVVERLETVRPYRNDLAHNLKIYTTDDYKELAENRVKPWLQEYKEFAADYMEKKGKSPRSLSDLKNENINKKSNKNQKIGR